MGVSALACFSKSEIDAVTTDQRVVAILERQHAMVSKPIRASPYHDIAMFQSETHWLVLSIEPAELEHRR